MAQQQLEVVGKVVEVRGQVQATAEGQAPRALAAGQAVYAGDRLQTGPESQVVIDLQNGDRFDLGRNDEAVLDAEVYGRDIETLRAEAVASREAVQAAIARGEDPGETGEAPAAGADEGEGPGDAPGAEVVVERTGRFGLVEAGYETDPLTQTIVRQALEQDPANQGNNLARTQINDAPEAASNAITVGEADQDTSLGLTAPTDPDGDPLTITVTGLPALGVVTLADGTPVTNGQELTATELAGLQYDGPGAGYDGSDVGDFTYTVDDGTNPPVPGSVDITVNAVNDAPEVASNAITVGEADQDTGLGLTAPTDADGDALTITVTGLPVLGVVTLADGTPVTNGQELTATELAGLQYDGPGAGYDGSDVGDFTYTVDDGTNPPVPGSVDITVNPDNDAPEVASNAITVGEADQDTGLGLTPPTDTDGDALTITVTGLPVLGVVTLADGTPVTNGQELTAAELAGLQYDGPGAGYDGSDVGDFTYTVDDGTNPPVPGSVDITVNAVNDAPEVASNAITVGEADQDTGLGLTAPTDADGDALTITVTGLPVLGVVTLADGTPVTDGQELTATELAGLQYDGPGAGYDGSDVGDFTYTVDDGTNPPVPGSVDITVNAVNDAPEAASNAITVGEADQDTGLGLTPPTDADGDALTITVTGLPVLGVVTLADGTPVTNGQELTATELAGLQYDGPGAGYDGSDVGDFRYTVDDGTNPPVPGSVDITVNTVNDAPEVASNAITVGEADQDTGLGLTPPTDADGDALTITVTGLPVLGVVTLADGTPVTDGQELTAAELAGLQYDGPGAGYDGSDVGDFTYTVDDGTNPPVPGSVDISVNATEDPPVAADDSASLEVGTTPSVSGNILDNDTDPDTPADELAVDNPGVYTGQYGTLTLNADGSYEYTVDPDAVAAAQLGPTAGLVARWDFDNAAGGTVADVAPEGVDDNTLDLNGNSLTADGRFGSAVELDGTSQLTLADSSDINLGIHGQRTIALHFNADDVSGRQVLYEEGASVRGLNIYIDDGRLYAGGWNTPTSQSGWAGDWIDLGPVTAGEWHHVALVLDGTDTVMPGALTGYLDGVNKGAVPGSQLWTHSGDVNLGGTTGTNRYHDGSQHGNNYYRGAIDDARVYNSALTDAEVASLVTPVDNLVDSFTYQATDGANPSNTATLDIELQVPDPGPGGGPKNDAPEVASGAITVGEADQDTGLGLTPPTDTDGDALTITVTGLPVLGVVTLADGTPVTNGQELTAAELAGLQYDGPGAGYDGSDVGDFTYTVDDGTNPPVPGSVDITVNAANDAPEVASNAITVGEADQDTGLGLTPPTDTDGDALTITVTGLPVLGVVTLADGTPVTDGQELTATELAGLQYDGPGAGYDGSDVGDFTYTVDDGTNPPVPGSVDISVNASEDAPLLRDEGNDLEFTELARAMTGVDWSSLSTGDPTDANGIDNANLSTVNAGSKLRVTFVEEHAGFSNVLGYYFVDQATGAFTAGDVIFANSNAVTDPVHDIDVPAGQTLGFFLIADGYDRYRSEVQDVEAGSASFEMLDNDGIPQLAFVQGATTQFLTEVYHSYDPKLNPEGYVRVATGVTDPAGDSLRIGFEDLPAARSDWDVRDLVFDVEMVDVYLVGETLAPGLEVSDPDGPIVSAELRLSMAQAGDALAFDSGSDVSLVGSDVHISGVDSGVDASFGAAGDELALSGSASAAVYQEILRAVAIENPDPTEVVSRSFELSVSDGTTTSTLTSHLGTDLAEVLSGGAGTDVIDGADGADALQAGAGDDILVHDAIDVVVDGGSGSDTLVVDGDITGLANARNFEHLDMQDMDGTDRLSLSLADVLDITDANDVLFVDGDSGDQVTIDTGDGWVMQSLSPGDADYQAGYTLYEAGAAKLYIEDQITVDIV